MEYVLEILRLGEGADTIIKLLEYENPELAKDLYRSMLDFTRLAWLDDRATRAVLWEADEADLVPALYRASEELREKVFTNLSERALAMLKEDMERAGPIEPGATEEARQRISSIMTRLEKTGEIAAVFPGGNRMFM